jgi:hypothetical protein
MSVTDIVRTIAKNVRQTVADPAELKEKAKDLPLNVLQTALTGVGQALMLSDRIRSGIKQLLSDDDDTAPEARPAASAVAPTSVVAEEREEKPARREPVIFAPRPGAGTPSAPGESRNGVTPQADAAVVASPPAPVPPMKPAPAAAETVTEPLAEKPAPKARKPRSTAKATAGTAARKAVPATAKAATGQAAPKPRTRKPKAEGGKLADAAQNVPEAPAPAPAPASVSAATTPAAVPSPTGTTSTFAEPLPGYSEMTMASLRSRLRGKSAEQLRSFIEYERNTKARDDILQMFAKRLAKIETGE